MAGYNEILVGRFARGLQKLTGIKGSAPAVTLSGDIGSNVMLPEDGVENRYLFSWQTYAVSALIGPVAAQTDGARLRNPLGPAINILMVLESLLIAFPDGAEGLVILRFGATNADLGTLAGTTRLDARGPQASSGAWSFTANTPPTFGAIIGRVGVLQNTTLQLIQTENQEIPILPGDAIQVENSTVNVRMQVSFRWRERFLEEPERT